MTSAPRSTWSKESRCPHSSENVSYIQHRTPILQKRELSPTPWDPVTAASDSKSHF